MKKKAIKKKINSKKKGSSGELELAHYLRGFGLDARRTEQYCGKTGDASDVVCANFPGLHVESKRTEKLQIYAAFEQATRDGSGKLQVVFHRKNNKPWICILDAAKLITVLHCAKLFSPDEKVIQKELDERAAAELLAIAAKRERRVGRDDC